MEKIGLVRPRVVFLTSSKKRIEFSKKISLCTQTYAMYQITQSDVAVLHLVFVNSLAGMSITEVR